MSLWSRQNDYLSLPEDVIAFAWSAPMRDLAVKFGTSDAGLRKIFVRYGIVLPPQGHWNRVHAGRQVQAPPKSAPRRPGGTGRMKIDPRFKPFIPEAGNLPASGPFANKEVPEDLEDLRALETKLVGRVSVPKNLDRLHPGMSDIMRREQKRRDKLADTNWSWTGPIHENPVDQRQLRLLNALFFALAKRGHEGWVYYDEFTHGFRPTVRICDTRLEMNIGIPGRRPNNARHPQRPDPSLPATTPLFISCSKPNDLLWQDEPGCRLEAQLSEIAVSLIVAGEATFRRDLKEMEARAEKARLEAERLEQEVRAKRAEERAQFIRDQNEKRVLDLHESGERFRRSQDLRKLVAQVREHLLQRENIAPQQMSDWEEWALAEADKIDPILSGQILSHLHPPAIPDEE